MSVFFDYLLSVLGALKTKGIILGGFMGLIHELHLVYLGKKELKKLPLVISVVVSSVMGHITARVCEGAGVDDWKALVYIAFVSLNAIVVVSTLSSRKVMDALVGHYTKLK